MYRCGISRIASYYETVQKVNTQTSVSRGQLVVITSQLDLF